MGNLALIEKDEDVYYNGIYIYEGSGHVGAGGWGVRARDQAPGLTGVSVLSLLHKPPLESDINYVSFRVLVAGTPATDTVIFSVWKKAPTALFFTQIYSYTVNQAVIQAQYGSSVTFANDTIFKIELPTALRLNASPNFEYYVAVYSTGCTLDYDTDGAVNGAYYVAADISASSTYAIAAMTLSDYAVSFECYTEPDAWSQVLYGGAIAEENTDWQNATYCTAVGWGTVANIYDGNPATSSTSTANGDIILIDVSGDNTLPTGDAWDPSLELSKKLFPDYTAYGVRALASMTVVADMGASGNEKIYVEVSDFDSSLSSSIGWQRMFTIEGTNAVTETFFIPAIARWVRFVKGGADTNQCDIDEVTINTVLYGITDGDFPVIMGNDRHHVWAENYPTGIKIYKALVKNMSGAQGSPGVPFTDRENVD